MKLLEQTFRRRQMNIERLIFLSHFRVTKLVPQIRYSEIDFR